MLMDKSFTNLYLVQGDTFQTLVSDLDPYIKQVGLALVQREIIHEKDKSFEFQAKDWIKKCGAVLLTYNLWMS